MTHEIDNNENNETNENSRMNRRGFIALGAGVGAAAVAAALAEPAFAAPQDAAKGAMKIALIKPKPLPEKIFTTEAAGISRKTHEEHFKLYTGYVNKTNEIRTKLAAMGAPDPTKANATYSDLRELKVEYSFALGGVKNHELYFGHLGGKGGDPTGDIADLITASFGSFANWKADLKATGMAARGWVWLAHDYTDNSVFNYIGDAQNTYPVWNATPLLGLDVYEHAYYLDFQTARAKYIDAYFSVLDWDAVNANLATAKAVAAAAKK